MSTTPDPKTVREIARKYLTDPDVSADELDYVVRSYIGYVGGAEHTAWRDAVRADADEATVTTIASWPDEQSQPDHATAARAAHLRKLVEFATRDGALRTVITDTESITGVALVCTSPDHPDGWEHHVRECCDEDAIELWHEKIAELLVAATTTIPQLLDERDRLQRRVAELEAEQPVAALERERDVWKSEAERRSAERMAASRRVGVLRAWLYQLGNSPDAVDERLRRDVAALESSPEDTGSPR